MKSTTRALLTTGLVVALGATMAVGTPAAPKAEAFSAGSKATVLNYLASIKGQKIVSGQHNKEPAAQPSQYTQRVKDITGVYPGLWGGDFHFGSADVANRQRVIDQAKTEWKNGSLVSLTWHVCPPTVGSSCTWSDVNADLTDTQWSQLVTNGTALNSAWKKRLDEIVPYLQQLKDAGVPAVFRPLHEMNEQWAWWGGRSGSNGSAKLYQITRDYLAGTKGMTNLIWAWNVQDNPAGGFANYYPGSSYVDVVTLDAWYKAFPSAAEYQSIRSIAASKPIALAEVGTMPTAANLSAQPEWTWFMEWSEQLEGSNTAQAIKDTYYNRVYCIRETSPSPEERRPPHDDRDDECRPGHRSASYRAALPSAPALTASISGAVKSVATATRAGSAVSGEPLLKGGCGLYSIESCVSSAASTLTSSASSVRPKSIPDRHRPDHWTWGGRKIRNGDPR